MKALLLSVALAISIAAPAAAAPEDVANRISEQIMSPYCPGVTLHDCPSAEADALRERIRDRAAAGWSEDRIMEELVAQYGAGIHAVPPADAGGIAAWVVPGLVALGGFGTAAMLARRWTRARDQDRAREHREARRWVRDASPEQRQRLAAELAAQRAEIAGTEPEATG